MYHHTRHSPRTRCRLCGRLFQSWTRHVTAHHLQKRRQVSADE
jgi:hypothetical protein